MFTARPHVRLSPPRRPGRTSRRLLRVVGLTLTFGTAAVAVMAGPAGADDSAKPSTIEVRDADGKLVEKEFDHDGDGAFDELWIYEDGVHIGTYSEPGADDRYGVLVVRNGSKFEVHTDRDGVGDTFDQVETIDPNKPDAEREFEVDKDGDGVFDVLVVPLPGGGKEAHFGSGDDELYNRIIVDRDGDGIPDEEHLDDNDDGYIDTTILFHPDGTTETIDRI